MFLSLFSGVPARSLLFRTSLIHVCSRSKQKTVWSQPFGETEPPKDFMDRVDEMGSNSDSEDVHSSIQRAMPHDIQQSFKNIDKRINQHLKLPELPSEIVAKGNLQEQISEQIGGDMRNITGDNVTRKQARKDVTDDLPVNERRKTIISLMNKNNSQKELVAQKRVKSLLMERQQEAEKQNEEKQKEFDTAMKIEKARDIQLAVEREYLAFGKRRARRKEDPMPKRKEIEMATHPREKEAKQSRERNEMREKQQKERVEVSLPSINLKKLEKEENRKETKESHANSPHQTILRGELTEHLKKTLEQTNFYKKRARSFAFFLKRKEYERGPFPDYTPIRYTL